MKSPKNLALIVLGLATLGGAALAWKQHLELVELRAAALSNNDRADLQKRLWDAQKRIQELTDELAALRGQSGAGDEETTAADDSTNQNNNQNRRGRRGANGAGGRGPGGNIATLLEQPAMQKLGAVVQKGQLDSRYAQLFKNLNLSPEQLDKLKNLMVERQTALQDVFAAARAQGINPRENREAFDKMIADTQAETDSGIKALLGDEGYAKYQNYQTTLPQRNVVNQLQQSLSYTNAPLSETQADQLVQILAQTSPRNGANRGQTPAAAGGDVTFEVTASADTFRGGPGGNNGRGGGGGPGFTFGFGGGGGGGGAQITDQTITLAQGVLSAQQVQGLQQLQQQQQAQQQLQQTIRQTLDPQRGNGNGGTGNRNSGGTNTGTGSGGTTATTNTRGG